MSQWLGWLFTTTPINARSVYAQNSSTALMTTRQNCSKYMTFRSLSKSYETSLARNAKKLLIFHVFIACAHHLVRTYYEPANHSYVRSTRAPRAGLPPTDQAAGMATAAVAANIIGCRRSRDRGVLCFESGTEMSERRVIQQTSVKG